MIRFIIEEWQDWESRLLIIMLAVIILIVLVGAILITWLILHPAPVPTIHLNGDCKQLYEGISTKGVTNYYPVNVCP